MKVVRQMSQTSVQLGRTVWIVILGVGAMLSGCGYTDFEMAAKQRQIDALVTQVNALKAGSNVANPLEGKASLRNASRPILSSR